MDYRKNLLTKIHLSKRNGKRSKLILKILKRKRAQNVKEERMIIEAQSG